MVPFSMGVYEEILSKKPASRKRYTFDSHPELYRMARILDFARRGAEPHLVFLLALVAFVLLKYLWRLAFAVFLRDRYEEWNFQLRRKMWRIVREKHELERIARR